EAPTLQEPSTKPVRFVGRERRHRAGDYGDAATRKGLVRIRCCRVDRGQLVVAFLEQISEVTQPLALVLAGIERQLPVSDGETQPGLFAPQHAANRLSER